MNTVIDLQMDIAASPEEVFLALTDSEILKTWFAEHALVNPGENQYAFWGKFTPEAPDKQGGTHTLLSYDPCRQIKYDWHVKGTDTTVEIALSPHQTGTLVSLLHDNVPEWQPGEYTIWDFWRVSLENLRCWVERKTIGGLCDFSTAMRGEVQLSIEIDAAPEEVFSAISDPEQLDRYISRGAKVDLKVGGDYSFGWDGGGPMKVLDVEPSKKLSYSWRYEGEPDTVVTWELEGSESRTRLTLVHSGFAPDTDDAGYRIGWTAYLNAIKSMSERGPNWQRVKTRQADFAS